MADDIDRAADSVMRDTEHLIARALKRPPMPVGTPGDCDLCGEWSGRLVEGACAPCRDRYKLP